MIRAIRDKVIIKRLEAETVSKGGIHLTSGSVEKPTKGKVMAVGTGKVLQDGTVVPPTVKPGDIVLIGKHGGTEIKAGEETLVVMKEDDILAIYD